MTEAELAEVAVPFGQVRAKLRATMAQHGVAVVTGVIPSREELAEFEADFAQDLAELVDAPALEAAPEAARAAHRAFSEAGPRAFPRASAARVTEAAGFCVRRCLCHGRFAWRARRHPGVCSVFRALYPDAGGDLVTGMDVTFFTPGGQPAAADNAFSAHADQNGHDVRPGVSEWESYQGVLYVWPAEADGMSSTTVVWPGSHRTVWPEMMNDRKLESTGRQGFHYNELRELCNKGLARRLAAGWAREARRVPAPAGALLLWNSRTVHTGWRGGPRLAQTVCMEPRARRTEEQRLAKLRLAALGLPSTHWASLGMQHDMTLSDPGYPAVAGGRARGANTDAELPLRPAIRPQALAQAADIGALRALTRVEFALTGMWRPPEDGGACARLLEDSVGEDFKRYL